ncbi:hypothetical protein [Phaeobacter sp. B1627]|uniref:hypothetical protein n=1 Tax=Phaeobacter sp. B1627 TaxID=2583809 RepID=UPI001119EF95|nr:hypothetical protein [Phaeobacter sp. B1627]TNJ39248.1 hypothetical protein FGE21_19055 [Phaeobacter sp. B1627]
MDYTVLRPHQGDKWYGQGARRRAHASDVAHLVTAGVLAPAAPDHSGDAAPDTKGAVPQNTAAAPPPETATAPVAEAAVKDQT